jgi:hypothetical protein
MARGSASCTRTRRLTPERQPQELFQPVRPIVHLVSSEDTEVQATTGAEPVGRSGPLTRLVAQRAAGWR